MPTKEESDHMRGVFWTILLIVLTAAFAISVLLGGVAGIKLFFIGLSGLVVVVGSIMLAALICEHAQ